MASGQKPFYIIFGVVIVAGGAFIWSRSANAGNISIPANVIVTVADTTGFRGYFIGSPDAPIEITEYGDLECPVCAAYAAVQFADIKLRIIDAGKARLRYRDFPLDGPHTHPRTPAHALACSNDQGHSWDVIEKMFETQAEWARASNPMPALTDIVKGVGVNVDTWMECMKSKKYQGRIQASLNEGTALGVPGTPTFLIAGKLYDNRFGSDQMLKLVDSLIAAGPPRPALLPGGIRPAPRPKRRHSSARGRQSCRSPGYSQSLP